jgi:hypothetical protein
MEKSDDDFETTTLAFRKKAETLYKIKGNDDRGDCVTGKVQNADGSGGETTKKGKRRFKPNKKSTYIQPEIWEKMTSEQQKAHREKNKAKKEKDSEQKPDATKPSLPMQYNAQSNQFTVTDNDGNVRTFSQTNSTASVPTGNAQRAANLLNSVPTQGGLFTVSNLKVKISSRAHSFVTAQQAQQVDTASVMCIDGGTNISLMGRAFRITGMSNRFADMCGFADELIKSNVQIGSGVSLYEHNGVKLLIGLHEAPYLENNNGSLLSTGQARENGVWIDDVLKRHGGSQKLVATDESGTPVPIPFDATNGLFQIHLRYPTDDEVDSLPIVWLTSNEVPWDPTVLDHSGESILPFYDGSDCIGDDLPFGCGFQTSEISDDLGPLVHEDRRQRLIACQVP